MLKIPPKTDVDHVLAQNVRSKKPTRFKVIMHNDDYTTMEFVIEVLQSIFHKESAEATSLMLQIHRCGRALCGLYPFEIAETKIDKVHKTARTAGFPLRCTLEPE